MAQVRIWQANFLIKQPTSDTTDKVSKVAGLTQLAYDWQSISSSYKSLVLLFIVLKKFYITVLKY